MIGAIQALLCWGLLQLGWTMSAAAPMVIALGIWLSGGLHHDGVMDTADGLAAGPERCLEAMEDSRVGASGVLALVMVLMLQLGALVQLGSAAPAALVTVGVWSRVAPLGAMARFPYLRRDGTAGFHRRHGRPRWDALPSGVVLLVLCIVLNPVMLLAGAPVALVVAEGLGRRLGGHTGDSYGAVLVLTETFTLVLLALTR